MRKFVLFMLVVLVDFTLKQWVVHHIPNMQPFAGYPFSGIGIFKTPWIAFSIVHTTNTGIAWGMLANFQIPLLIIRFLITLGILVYLVFFNPEKKLRVPLTLITAGASGNIIDFFVHGHVIDMFYVILKRYSFPVFNTADAVICCAVIYLLFLPKKSHFRRHANSP